MVNTNPELIFQHPHSLIAHMYQVILSFTLDTIINWSIYAFILKKLTISNHAMNSKVRGRRWIKYTSFLGLPISYSTSQPPNGALASSSYPSHHKHKTVLYFFFCLLVLLLNQFSEETNKNPVLYLSSSFYQRKGIFFLTSTLCPIQREQWSPHPKTIITALFCAPKPLNPPKKVKQSLLFSSLHYKKSR